MMAIGLDLGTSLTKLVLDQGNPDSSWSPILQILPTAVTQDELASDIPSLSSAPGIDASSGVSRFDAFTSLFRTHAADEDAAFGGQTSGEVAQEFLRLLLDKQELADLGTAGSGRLVVAVPPMRHDRGTSEEAVGSRIKGILASLGHPPQRLVTAPVASILYLRHKYQNLDQVTHYLVCDAGAASITLSMCAADGQRFRLVDFITRSGTGAWDQETPGTGAAGRQPILIEGLLAAVAREIPGAGTRLTARRVLRYWRAFESVLADQDQLDRMDAVLERAARSPERFGTTTAFHLDGVAVTAAQVEAAWKRQGRRCTAALTDLLERHDATWPDLRDPACRVVLTGGLSALRPLRTTLLSAAGLDPAGRDDSVIMLGGVERLASAAYGAALIASGRADPGDRYPYGLRLLAHRQIEGRIKDQPINLAEPGSIEADQVEPRYLRDDDGAPRLVTIGQDARFDRASPVPVEVVIGGHPEPAAFLPATPPPPGRYLIGVCADQDGAAIVLQSAEGSDRIRYVVTGPRPGTAAGEPDE